MFKATFSLRRLYFLNSVLCLLAVIVPDRSMGEALLAPGFREQIESDWLLQEQYRGAASPREITTAADALGGCEGIKDGKWGFHTELSRDPWWQVDLGHAYPIGRVVLWNRCDVPERIGAFVLLFSEDGETWNKAYTHDSSIFRGFTDGKPLAVDCAGRPARWVRIQVPGRAYLHLDEVEVFDAAAPEQNLALGRPADQCSISEWSSDHRPPPPSDWDKRTRETLAHCRRLAEQLRDAGLDSSEEASALALLENGLNESPETPIDHAEYLKARWLQRRLSLKDPLLNFDSLLFVKRVPGSFNHMSDQYYGWWSRPGGGLYLLRDYKSETPQVECLSDAFQEPGSFLRPALDYEARKVLFAWCRYYPDLAAQPDKLNKANVPEDAFYHVFEMNLEDRSVRQLTHGKYDDFDARYLPNGRIVFLSTRRGQALQCGPQTAALTLAKNDLPDSYVRCGGGPERPVAVYTLHTMDEDGGELNPISPFEMFEWTPSLARDGTILYSRWDYIDRDNMPYMSLWSIHPDGTNARLVYGNFTPAPHCTFEPRSIPNSNKIIFTASGHHAQTMGSLVLLDPSVGTEGDAPVTRLTPEVVFPEIEAWPKCYFANPWPLSEERYLVSWGCEGNTVQGQLRPINGFGLYYFDAGGDMELLYRDPDIGSECPIPIVPRPKPPTVAGHIASSGETPGTFLVSDVYQGLPNTPRGTISLLRIVAVPAKTHPTMNFPNMGIMRDDPGKAVLGTVPVEPDGSAHFRVPAGMIVFFQALDREGRAVQTMRSATHVQPGQTLSCTGCHEPRLSAPVSKRVLAAAKAPARITPGPPGSWPLRFDRLVQPVLDQNCVTCHHPAGALPQAAEFDLTAENAWQSLCGYGNPSLNSHVRGRYRDGRSLEGGGAAITSPLLAKLTAPDGHHGVHLDQPSLERLVVWIDTYGQRLGSFSNEQEQELLRLRDQYADLFVDPGETLRNLPLTVAAQGRVAEISGHRTP